MYLVGQLKDLLRFTFIRMTTSRCLPSGPGPCRPIAPFKVPVVRGGGGWKLAQFVAEGVAGKPGSFTPGSRLRQGSLPGTGTAIRAGQLADGGGSTGGVVRITAGQRRSQGRIKPPTAQSGAKLKGLSAGQQAQTAVLTPFAAPSNTTQGKTALFRGFLEHRPNESYCTSSTKSLN